LSSVADRNQLITESNLIETGVIDPALCLAQFNVEYAVGCVGQMFRFHDTSYHGVIEWTWDFGDGTVISGTDPDEFRDPIHIYETAGNFSVSMTVSNGSTTLTETWPNLITVFGYGESAPPLEEGFENTWPNSNWATFNYNQDLTWEITPSASFTGDKSLKLRNFSNTTPGNMDELLSATYDMSAMDTIFLSYRWAYANKSGETEDRLRISVTGDCGDSWSVRRTMYGTTNLPTSAATSTQFTPTLSSQWGSETLILTNPNWMTDAFRVKFEFTGYAGNNIFLEDINITSSDTTGNFVGINELNPTFVFGLYPNPAKESATLKYYANQREVTSIKMYNSLGELVEVIAQGEMSVGEHIYTINRPAAGLYTVVFERNGSKATERLAFN
jgi:PKD repeat protein